MELYTCISCGNEKESESTCSCPICGYKMLKMPYERKRAVASEIEHFSFLPGRDIGFERGFDL